jgi:AraC-like DNA-binding protein
VALGLACEHRLHLVERVVRDEGFVRAFVALAEPPEVAGVDRVLEHAVEFGDRHAAVTAVVTEPHLVHALREGFEGYLPSGIQLEHTGDEGTATDVCLDVGCSSLGSFSDLFTRRLGESPSAYRRRWRSSTADGPTSHVAVQPGCLTLLAHLPADQTFEEASLTSR